MYENLHFCTRVLEYVHHQNINFYSNVIKALSYQQFFNAKKFTTL
jgi:hypothetical protein